jgi:hypothetical protein
VGVTVELFDIEAAPTTFILFALMFEFPCVRNADEDVELT